MVLKLKNSSPPCSPFSWDTALPPTPPVPSPSQIAALPSPPTSWLSARDMKMFGAIPLKSEVGIVKCIDCDKPVLRSAYLDHKSICASVRSGAGKKAGNSIEELKKGKKRKGEEEEDPNQPNKKKKANIKVTKGRFKGPIDYDKHCGVINDKNLPCSRSLTCKSHSMGAKRSVQGRSKPYDELLLDWNRANNPNFVEPVKRETKQERKERKEREKAEKKKQAIEAAAAAGIDITKKSSVLGPKKGKRVVTVMLPQPQAEDDDENFDDIDSEAEMDTLVHAMRTAQNRGLIGTPLAVPCDAGSFFVARRERLRSCRGLYENAFKRGGVMSVAGSAAPIAGGVVFR